MRYRIFVFFSICFMASALSAQVIPSSTVKGADSWSEPAPASSIVVNRDHESSASKPSSSPFKFKRDERPLPGDKPPPSAMDKASVLGLQRPWQNGQAPVDCASSPHSSVCQH